jgi:predicted ArsR family transcriptional regulator
VASGPLADVPEARRRLLLHLKERGDATIGQLTAHLGTSGEAVRQQIVMLVRAGWIRRHRTEPKTGAGRPAARYRLTADAEKLFPKRYQDLAVMLVDIVADALGTEALTTVLRRVTDLRVAALAPHIDGKTLPEKVEALRAIYEGDDPFIEVEPTRDGFRLVERNCPFLDVALSRPLLCSSTVSVLTRLLGRHVEREDRFQDGCGRCSFRIYADRPVNPQFSFREEPPRAPKPS